MFNFADDQEFLEAIGIANAPDDTKQRLIAGLEETAERKMTRKLSETLSDDKAAEFGKLVDGSTDDLTAWLTANAPQYKNSAEYGAAKEHATDISEEEFLRGFAIMKYIQANIPNFVQLAAEVRNEILNDILSAQTSAIGIKEEPNGKQ